jgi:hypothetical protein
MGVWRKVTASVTASTAARIAAISQRLRRITAR